MKALVCGMIGFELLPKPRKGPEMKDSKESMDIIEAYDLFGSYNGAARFVGCSPNTSKEVGSGAKCRATYPAGSIREAPQGY